MGGPSGELLAALQTSVSDVAGSFRIERTTPVAGGCIHRCFILEGGGRRYFAKTNDRSALDSFAAEADGLAALAAAGARVPATLCQGQAGEQAFLVLEHLELRGNGDYGAPVLFDPAVYRGDREADLAMTELFGGFPQAFYSAYAEAAPPAQGYAVRKMLYNLYHVLNHANLFGGGYAAQAKAMIERLLAELR